MHPIFKNLGVAVETAQTAGVAGNGSLRIGLIASLSKGIVREVIEALVAEREGFEPPEPFGSTVFKTAAFDHSATSPSPDTDGPRRERHGRDIGAVS